MRHQFTFLFICISLFGFGQKKLVYDDRAYEEQIRTVLLYPAQGTNRDYNLPASIPIDLQNLVLEFDDLQDDRNNYYIKLIHCDYDWKKSILSDLDFMAQYNEQPVNNYTISVNTSIRYFHYLVPVPAVKLPGNYLLIAYREGDTDDVILSKRMMVYANRVSFLQDKQLQGFGTLRATNQQLNFLVNYPKSEIVNPLETVHTIIRQNQRWDNARMQVHPSFIREDKGEMEYRFFDQDNQFKAGNEFRFVDFRSLNFPGQNTGRLDRSQRPFLLTVQKDGSRQQQVYSQYLDLNGQFILDNLDFRGSSGDYLYVTFTLDATPQTGAVYVLGAFNNWLKSEENKMAYNAKSKQYEATLLMKQGWYDYQYWIENNSDCYALEGSHFETENFYEIFVYYRPFRPNADLLIGYYTIRVNQR